MIRIALPMVALLLACSTATQAQPVEKAPVPVSSPLTYADLADLALASQLAIKARVRDAVALKPEESPGLKTGRVRFYVTADVAALIRGPAGVAPRLSYLADVPLDSRGRPPKLRKRDVLLLALPVAGKPGEIRLAAPDAQLDWSADVEARLRAVLTEIGAPNAPPRVTGVSSAFHTPGTITGEGETQIFLTTADRQPVSLSVLRRPGETPRWAVSFGEIVDEASGPPRRETLGWYRLACFLPRRLPATAVEGESGATAAEDYATVIAGLGPCPRTRT